MTAGDQRSQDGDRRRASLDDSEDRPTPIASGMSGVPESGPPRGATGRADLVHAEISDLHHIVDKRALNDLCRSFFELFGISIRIVSNDGGLLADAHQQREICQYVNGTKGGKTACANTVNGVRACMPTTDFEVRPCFTGAAYRVQPIRYDGKILGRFVIGPYFPAETTSVPRSLLVIDPAIDPEAARTALTEMPRVKEATVAKFAAHLTAVLEYILFAGHRSLLTTEMHLASVRESYRELESKNERLESALVQVREMDRLKSNFLSTISHELRTPLTSIIGYADMLKHGMAGALSGEQTEFVDTIRGKGELLLRMITSLLDLGKLEQGRLKLDREPVDVPELLRDIANTVKPVATKRGVVVAVDTPTTMALLNADSVRLRQIVTNVLENAIKFSKGTSTVHVRAQEVEWINGSDVGMTLLGEVRPAVQISITDSGIGMPPDQLDRIFDAFYQIDGGATREHGGAGLGLSIVKRLVEAHDGTIEVQSEPNVGTTFTVTIPHAES